MAQTEAKFRLGITEAGKTLLRGTVFVLLAAMVVPAFGVLAALAAVIVTALVIGFVLRPRIRITGDLPERIVAGQAIRLTYTLENVGARPAYQLAVQFAALAGEIELVAEDRVVARLAPGETTQATVTIRPKRRGHYTIGPPVCRSGFPFDLFSFGVSPAGAQTLTVLPPFHRLGFALARRCRPAHARGDGLVGQAEFSPEYAGNRPFLPGDSPRTIDVRAWARLSVPATKEYLNDADSYAALILDTRATAHSRSSRSRAIRQLDAAVSLCASLAFTTSRDCRTDLLLIGTEMHEFSAWPVPTRLDRIHDLLAGAEASQDYHLDAVQHLLGERFSRLSEVMFVLLALDATYTPILEMATRARCHSSVFVVAEGGDPSGDRLGGRWADRVVTLSAETILAGPIERL